MGVRRDAPAEVDDTASWRPRVGAHTSILFDVFVLGQRARALVNQAMHDSVLRPDEYAAYSVVFEMQPVTLTEMAEQLAMPLTTVAEYVGAMADRAHVVKKPDPDDQRARLLTLTPAGIRAHRQASRTFERAYQALLRELAPLDEDAAREVLQRLAGSVERALEALQVSRAGSGRSA
jgi:DNA-binding MarR family transcriptional regulator